MSGLYIHVPFCVRKCLYCDFYSLPTGLGAVSKRLGQREAVDQTVFMAALTAELRRVPQPFSPETIFIGGGTPTELSNGDFQQLLDQIRRHVDISRVVEWTCEANPGTLTREKALLMRKAGINRVSLGVQSFDDRTLEFLGRIHSSAEAEAGFRLLREHGFENINLDLMYGVPGQSLDSARRDLERLIALGPEHASCYCLIFEDGTPLTDLRNKGYVREVDDETEREQYNTVRASLNAAGYRHYEISNFAQPGHECRHNLLYWGGGEYIGCGPSAHSHWNGARWGNIRSLEKYCERLLSGRSPRAFEERIEPEAKARETLVMGLRRMDGVSRSLFRAETGHDLDDLCGDTLKWLCEIGMLESADDRVRLTDEGLFVSDAVFAELV